MTTTSDEFYTPLSEINLVRSVLGHIHLDPASCVKANEIVQARVFYSKEDDGLVVPWLCTSLFLNPPFSRRLIGKFANRFVYYGKSGSFIHGIILVNANTSSSWFQMLMTECDAVCFCGAGNGFPSRIKFVGGVSTARAASAYFYFGRSPEKFIKVFSRRGKVIKLN